MQPTFLNGKSTTIWICIKQRTLTGPLFMSLKIRERVMALRPFFHELENQIANWDPDGSFVHEPRNWKACNGPVG